MTQDRISSSKAANLKTLAEDGFPVPRFWVLSLRKIENLLEPVRGQFEELRAALRVADEKEWSTRSAAIRELLMALKIPPEELTSIKQQCIELFGSDYEVAVRSSAIHEDKTEASFAGQMETYLHVKESGLEDKIKACLASAYSVSAIRYRKLAGFDPADGRMEVIIQTMIFAEKSGVIFTVNPNGNLNETAVVAGLGAGEGVVSGIAETDHYFIDRTNQSIRQKTFSGEAILEGSELLGLFEFGQKSEALFDQPQDLEFSIDLQGKVWVLQSRPITGIPYDDLKILDNSNIIESYPGITLPLSFSFARNGYEQVFRGCARPFGISDNDLDERQEALSNLITHLNGRVYYRLDNWYRIMSLVMTSEKQLKEWENNLGIRKSESRNIRVGYRKKLKSAGVVLKLLLTHRKLNSQFYRDFEKSYARLQEAASKDWPSDRLFSFYKEKANILFRAWAPTQVNDFIGFRAFSALQQKLAQIGFKEEENLANDLMCGMQGVESEQPMLKLLEMKKMIKSEKDLCELFTSIPPAGVLEQIQQPEYRSFKRHFDLYLDKYGDRTLEELKLETPSLRQQPEQLVRRIQQHLDTPHSVESFRQRQFRIREGAEQRLKAKLPFYRPGSWVVRLLIHMSRYGLRNRENMRLARTRSYGVVKDIFQIIARRMAAEKALTAPADIFYLDHSDVEEYCRGKVKSDFRKKVDARKAEFEQYQHLEMPNRVIYFGDEPPYFEGTSVGKEGMPGNYKGIPVSRGKVEAPVVVLHQPNEEVDVKDKILVTRMTDPGWLFLMSQAKGLISEKGSLLSHTAIVGRELGLPTIVGVDHATQLFKSGQVIHMDGASGIIEVKE